jgi:hypothetical protein
MLGAFAGAGATSGARAEAGTGSGSGRDGSGAGLGDDLRAGDAAGWLAARGLEGTGLERGAVASAADFGAGTDTGGASTTDGCDAALGDEASLAADFRFTARRLTTVGRIRSSTTF